MPEAPGYGRRKREASDEGNLEDAGDEALHFTKWFVKNKFTLMESFAAELARPPETRDPESLRRRFTQAIDHAKRVLLARLVVTVLLAFGAVTTAAATVLNLVWVPADIETGINRILDQIAAVAGSLTVLLVILRLAFDRYLELIGVSATFTAMQMTSTHRT